MSKTKIVEAAGRAGGTGPALGARIEAAMGQAILAMNERGVVDDTPAQRVTELLGADFEGKDGATVIREAKIAARAAAKAAYREEEAQRLAAEAAAAEAAAAVE